MNDDKALKCWNLERIIDAEEKGMEMPQPLTFNDLLGNRKLRKSSRDNLYSTHQISNNMSSNR